VIDQLLRLEFSCREFQPWADPCHDIMAEVYASLVIASLDQDHLAVSGFERRSRNRRWNYE
jgi:hypothetical protein